MAAEGSLSIQVLRRIANSLRLYSTQPASRNPAMMPSRSVEAIWSEKSRTRRVRSLRLLMFRTSARFSIIS